MTMRSAGQDNIPWCGAAPAPAQWLTSWNFDPKLLIGLAIFLGVGLWQAGDRRVFLLAWAGLVLAFASPLCALTTAFFAARAVHHLLLVSVVAPLLALAKPWHSQSGLGVAPLAMIATLLALVLWHVPRVYSAAWHSDGIYWLLQLALILPAWAFWAQVFASARGDFGEMAIHAALIGGLAAGMGLIGAVLTFAPRSLYLEHLAGTALWQFDPLADQQLAGLIMWVPGLLPLAIAAAVMARRAWRLGAAL